MQTSSNLFLRSKRIRAISDIIHNSLICLNRNLISSRVYSTFLRDFVNPAISETN